ncbi:HI1506-related protein [Pseudomonas sp. Fl4BN1]|uniref:HI1506-related protein n=1 Tax=Pseudomonas sp. Fl4BN1 TaxID=2697651 RepID=UPI001377CB63|nr:HI1506-related protein [Pseudomonas sp. Fl4BN1]NBF12855.1 hypothetical protein [Pseudomonas sp. Fl4BN1]
MAFVIVITAKRNGFRRCGVAHSDQPTTWQPDDFTEEQWEALFKEPQLFVTTGEVDLDSERERNHGLTSATSLPQASNALEEVESKAPETVAAPLGHEVDLPISSILGGNESGPDGAEPGQVGSLTGQGSGTAQDGGLGIEHPDGSDNVSQAPPLVVADEPSKGKGRPSKTKPKDDDK